MTIKQLAKELKASEQFCRMAIRLEKYPFAVAVKMSSVWTYQIDDERFKLWREGRL